MKGIRIGICVLLAFSVVAHGAVEPWSESVLEIGAALLFLSWGLFKLVSGTTPTLRWNWLLAPLAALWLFAVVQYLTGLTSVLFLTKIEILKLSALVILSFLTVQAYETLEHWRGFVWFVLALGFLVSVFGIVQHFTFNGKLYWIRELRYGGVPFGPYVNRNHFAGLIELIVPTGLSILVLRAEERQRMPLLTVLTLLPIGALFLSASRGGIVSVLIEIGLIMILALLRGQGRHQFVAGAIVLLLASSLVAWLGVGSALNRFTTYRALEVTETRRAELRRDTWKIFLDHPIVGTGLGTFEAIFPRYETLYDGNVVEHAHNDYLEALAETGTVGGLICSFFLLLLFQQTWVRLAHAESSMALAFHVGGVVACCGLLIHSLVDFNLHIPSNVLLFLMQAVLATSLITSNRRVPAPPRKDTGKYPIPTATGAV
jgi:O-antigen ligase